MLTNEELYKISGGGITATLINAISRFGSFLFNLGRSIGSSLRRKKTKNYC